MSEPWTKGPWRVGQDEVKPIDYLWSLHVYAGDETAEVDVAWCSCSEDGAQSGEDAPRLDEARANARLLAAAPALVEALDDLLAEQNGPPLIDPRHERAWQRAMDNAAAILARVRGETKEQQG